MRRYVDGGSEVLARFVKQGLPPSLSARCRVFGFLLASALSTQPAALGQQNQFYGSVPTTGAPSSTPLALTFHDAIERGLKTNLGLLTSESTSETVRGERMEALSALLPKLDARATQAEEQVSLKTLGFNLKIPGVSIPTIVGPFHYTDVRAYASWTAYDYTRAQELSGLFGRIAAPRELSSMDARDLVVAAAANAYLQIIADASRVDAIRSQVETSQALYDRANDQQNAGTAAGIDVLRSHVELKQQQQRLLAQPTNSTKTSWRWAASSACRTARISISRRRALCAARRAHPGAGLANGAPQRARLSESSRLACTRPKLP